MRKPFAPRRAPWSALAALLVCQAGPALAQTTDPNTPAEPPEDSAERWNARETPLPPDQRSGHFVASGSFGWVLPFGTVSEDASQSARFGSGLAYQADLGFGVGRSVVVGLWGQFLTLSDGSACTDCGGTSLAGGPFVRYYLVQGLRFDPWLSFGIGYRTQRHDVSGSERRYSGLDWARVQFGGDWYAFPQLGVGPFVELGAGSFFTRPDDESGGGVPWRFIIGARITLDVPGHQAP